MFKLIHGNCIDNISKYDPDLVIADIPWDRKQNYNTFFDIITFNHSMVILVDNCIEAFHEYIKHGTKRFRWFYNGIWLHGNTFTHILGFCGKGTTGIEDCSSIVEFKDEHSTSHPEQRPVKLMEYIMEHFTARGSLVLDPFMGTGASAIAAKKLEHDYIGIELNEQFYTEALGRLNG